MNKRGISPLIATVLLIGFTIAIASIVSTVLINRAKSFNPEDYIGADIYCDSVAMTSQISDSTFKLVNKGSFTIWQVTVDDLNQKLNGDDGLSPGETTPADGFPCPTGGNSYLITPWICDYSKEPSKYKDLPSCESEDGKLKGVLAPCTTKQIKVEC